MSSLRDFLSADWMTDAECQNADSELFFGPKGDTGVDAKKVCNRCPVREECLEFAIEHNERWGIWGGMTPEERMKLKRLHKGVA